MSKKNPPQASLAVMKLTQEVEVEDRRSPLSFEDIREYLIVITHNSLSLNGNFASHFLSCVLKNLTKNAFVFPWKAQNLDIFEKLIIILRV